MNDRAFDVAVRDWLEDGADRASPAAMDAVLLAIKTTPQDRDLRILRRFTVLPIYLRAAAAVTIVAIAGVGILAILNGGSGIGTVPTAPPSPSPLATEGVGKVVLPAARPLAPTAVIELGTSDSIPISSDGVDVWIGVTGAVIHVDGQTNAQTRVEVADMAQGNGALLIVPDGLWITDFRGSRVERVNPATGAVELQTSVPNPLGFLLMDDNLWVTSQGDEGVYPVDRTTGALGQKIGSTYQVTLGVGEFWEGQPGMLAADTLTRLDPSTGNTTGTITVPAGSACAIEGSFPDNVWAGCTVFARAHSPMTVVRIDPATNAVKAQVTLPEYAGLAAVVDGVPWFFVVRREAGQDHTTLVAADPATGALVAALDLGALSPNLPVLTSRALWIPDEQGKRVLRYDLATLRP
jgi:hypothetical protein